MQQAQVPRQLQDLVTASQKHLEQNLVFPAHLQLHEGTLGEYVHRGPELACSCKQGCQNISDLKWRVARVESAGQKHLELTHACLCLAALQTWHSNTLTVACL